MEECEREITVTNKKGLHARAAAKFVRTAELFEAKVVVTKIAGAGVGVTPLPMEANGSSILGIMMLGCECGSKIKLHITGIQNAEAADALEKLLADKFGEE